MIKYPNCSHCCFCTLNNLILGYFYFKFLHDYKAHKYRASGRVREKMENSAENFAK